MGGKLCVSVLIVVLCSIIAFAAPLDVRGVGATYWQVADQSGRLSVLGAVQKAQLNMLIVDAKTEDGMFGYTTAITAQGNYQWSDGQPVVELVKLFHNNGLQVGARVSVGQDALYGSNHPAQRFSYSASWINLCNQEYRDYVKKIVQEVAQKGVDMVNLDFFRAPDYEEGSSGQPVCSNGVKYSDLLVSYAQDLTTAAKAQNPKVRVSIDVFGRSAKSDGSDPIGQTAQLATPVDYVMPMLYKSYLEPGKSVGDYVRDFENAGVAQGKLKPWIQGWSPYDSSQSILADVSSLSGAGATGFSIWWLESIPPESPTWGEVGTGLTSYVQAVNSSQTQTNQSTVTTNTTTGTFTNTSTTQNSSTSTTTNSSTGTPAQFVIASHDLVDWGESFGTHLCIKNNGPSVKGVEVTIAGSRVIDGDGWVGLLRKGKTKCTTLMTLSGSAPAVVTVGVSYTTDWTQFFWANLDEYVID